jgi:glycosyltransferase involved in cell wall biosynthesis
MHRHIHLAAVGDANYQRAFSGIPFYLLQEGMRQGLLDSGLSLFPHCREQRCLRIAWNCARILRCDTPGGYQFSIGFLERLYHGTHQGLTSGTILSCFQLLPPSLLADSRIDKWFYIDMTLKQMFECYGQSRIGRMIREESLRREAVGYRAAVGVITHSRWAAASVISDYGVAPDRVHVVVPGAGLDRSEYEHWESQNHHGDIAETEELKLVFVGKDWRRKGLDRLLGAFALARKRNFNATLTVIGCSIDVVPSDLRATNGVSWVGFIDKHTEGRRFIETVGRCHIGCLLSRAEAGGIGLREFHALGLAVVGPDVNGAPEHMFPGASIAISPSATDREIAEVLLDLDTHRDKLNALRSQAWSNRRLALWSESVRRLLPILVRELDSLNMKRISQPCPPAGICELA